MSDFRLDDDLEAFRAQVRKLAEREFAPRAAHWDEHEEFPEANRRLLGELGYFGTLIPPEYGGSGGRIIQSCLLVEEVARVCFNTASVCQIAVHGPSRAITVLGSEALKRRLLPGVVTGEHLIAISISEPQAGSAVTDLRTRAVDVGDAYLVNGHKCFTTLGNYCTHLLVMCRFGESSGARGIGALIVDRDTPGLHLGKPDKKMGGRGAPECEVFFDDCRVPKANLLVPGDPNSTAGFKRLMDAFGPERCGNAAICVGLAQGAYDTALEYARQREQFGRPIMEFQGIQWKIADMATQLHAARLMVYRAAMSERDGFPDPRDTTIAKLYANEMVQRVTSEALQIHGHSGYTRALPLERMMRDGRGYAVGGGTVEILRNTLAALEFGRSFDQRRG
jgi:alkylation response protein AidB-like acyl-CoA dehydrogenase